LRIILGITGVAVIVGTVLDVLWTTLRLTGGGWLTSWLTDGLWKLSLRITRKHHVLSVFGFFIVLFTVVFWVLMIWAGWTLVMEGAERAVVESATGRPADLWARIYFSGSMLTTIGNSEYRPGSTGWRLLSAVAAANGFSMFTLVITYLLPIVTEEVNRRRLAVYITSLGRTPQEILLRAWNGSDFGLLPDHLLTLTQLLTEVGQGHLAYPVLHVVHSRTRETALAPSIAVLDEAVTLFEGVRRGQRPDGTAFYPLRQAVAEFLSTLKEAHLKPEGEPPPHPELGPLREAGIGTVSDEEFRKSLESLDERRRLLLGLVQQEGWSWEDVTRPTTDLEERFRS
jgi:hypothetical protein